MCGFAPTKHQVHFSVHCQSPWRLELRKFFLLLSICSMQRAPCTWVYWWFPWNLGKEPTVQQFLWKKVRDLQERAVVKMDLLAEHLGGFTYLCKECGDRLMRWFSTKCGWRDGQGPDTCSWDTYSYGWPGRAVVLCTQAMVPSSWWTCTRSCPLPLSWL